MFYGYQVEAFGMYFMNNKHFISSRKMHPRILTEQVPYSGYCLLVTVDK